MTDDTTERPVERGVARAHLVKASVAVIVVALLFVVMVVLIPYLQEKQIRRKIESIGGGVTVAYFGPVWFSPSLRNLFPFFDRITVVDLSRTKDADSVLPEFMRLTHLNMLDLDNSDVSDDGLRHLRGLVRLQGLGLNRTGISDAGLEHLQDLVQLRGLHLAGTDVTDRGLRSLGRMSLLEVLGLGDAMITDQGIEDLKGFGRLDSLEADAIHVSVKAIMSLRRELPKCTFKILQDTPIDLMQRRSE